MIIIRGVLATIMALLLTACAVGPNFERLEAPVEETWLEASNSKLNTTDFDDGAWWTLFNDQVLIELVEQAVEENLTLQVAAVRILEARAGLGVARGFQFPQQQDLTGRAVSVGLSENAPNLAIADQSFWNVAC